MSVLSNPWAIGIGTAIAAGLVLYFVFGIGKPRSRDKPGDQGNTSVVGSSVTVSPTITVNPTITVGPIVTSTPTVEPGQAKLPPSPVATGPNASSTTRFTSIEVTPYAIVDFLDGLPPLQREQGAGNYKGLRVSWQVTLESAYDGHDGKCRLIVRWKEEKTHHHLILAEADLELYPELKIMREGQEFTLEGDIKEVRGANIELTNCRLIL